MTAGVFYNAGAPEGWDPKDPANVSPPVVWLGSDGRDIAGRVFECSGEGLNVCNGWQHGPVESVGERPMTPAEAADLARASVVAERPRPRLRHHPPDPPGPGATLVTRLLAT